MDEIQESMDTADENEGGLRSLGEMRKRGTGGGNVPDCPTDDVVGAVTTIGFGVPSVGGPSGDVAFGVGDGGSGSGAAIASGDAAARPTMMIVKKRKKKPSSEQLQPAARGEEESTKRLRTD